MTYWEHYTLIISLYALASVSGMGLVVPCALFADAEDGKVSWRTAHIFAFFTAYLPLGLALLTLLDHATFGLIKAGLTWLE